jgi:hypothetical protein
MGSLRVAVAVASTPFSRRCPREVKPLRAGLQLMQIKAGAGAVAQYDLRHSGIMVL